VTNHCSISDGQHILLLGGAEHAREGSKNLASLLPFAWVSTEGTQHCQETHSVLHENNLVSGISAEQFVQQM